MSLEERHWPSLCIVALLLVLSVVAVVEVCADATPDINAVLNNAIAIYLDFMVSSIVNRNTGCSALVPLAFKRPNAFGPLPFKCGDRRSTDTWHSLGQPCCYRSAVSVSYPGIASWIGG